MITREKDQNSGKNSWQHTQNSEYLQTIKNRIESVDLTWVTQFLDFIAHLEKGEYAKQKDNNLSIKDIGSQTFQVYKQIKSKGLYYKYFGYEIDKTYVDLGLEYFPELKSNVTLGNFLEIKTIHHTDISVCSATIEHIDNWILFLEKMLSSTSNYAYIRTFMGETTQRVVGYHHGATEGYPIWQFSFHDMFTVIQDLGFYPELRKDKYTDSLPRLLNISPNGVIRSMFVIQAKRIK